jgi:hypothetical protein
MMGDEQDMDIFQIDASSALKSTSNLPKTLVKHNNPQRNKDFLAFKTGLTTPLTNTVLPFMPRILSIIEPR